MACLGLGDFGLKGMIVRVNMLIQKMAATRAAAIFQYIVYWRHREITRFHHPLSGCIKAAVIFIAFISEIIRIPLSCKQRLGWYLEGV